MSNKNHKNKHFEKLHTYKKAKQRELYRMMQSNKKEALLAREQTKLKQAGGNLLPPH